MNAHAQHLAAAANSGLTSKIGRQCLKPLSALSRKYIDTLSSYVLTCLLTVNTKNKITQFCVLNPVNITGKPLSERRLFACDLTIASRETRISFNSIAYFFSAFFKDNNSANLLQIIPVFCNQWERDQLCVRVCVC